MKKCNLTSGMFLLLLKSDWYRMEAYEMKIAVVGSINMDLTVQAERIPLKGETLQGSQLKYVPGGKGANQAVAMARLGATVEMFGCVGDDSMGQSLLDNLEQMGVITENIKVVEKESSGLALITIGECDNTIVIVAGANAHVDKTYIDSIQHKLLEYDIILLQHEIPVETNEYVVDLCWGKKNKVILNPGPARPISQNMIEKLDYITPNEHEAAIIFGNEVSTDEILKKYPGKLVITQGSRGVSVGVSSEETLLVPARKANVVDTTGAGDTLNAAFAVQIASGSSITDALAFANVAASLSTEKFGAQGGMPTMSEVEEAMKGGE